MKIALKQLRGLIKALNDTGVGEFEYQDDEFRVRLVLGGGKSTRVSVRPRAAPGGDRTAKDEGVVWVTSPFVGTFYRSASPDAPPFVELGERVDAGGTVCIVEAMKLMNEIESEHSGTVLEVLAENGDSVEYGQKLFKIQLD